MNCLQLSTKLDVASDWQYHDRQSRRRRQHSYGLGSRPELDLYTYQSTWTRSIKRLAFVLQLVLYQERDTRTLWTHLSLRWTSQLSLPAISNACVKV